MSEARTEEAVPFVNPVRGFSRKGYYWLVQPGHCHEVVYVYPDRDRFLRNGQKPSFKVSEADAAGWEFWGPLEVPPSAHTQVDKVEER